MLRIVSLIILDTLLYYIQRDIIRTIKLDTKGTIILCRQKCSRSLKKVSILKNIIIKYQVSRGRYIIISKRFSFKN